MDETNLPKKLSPSSINTYLQCPRKFYYTYILNLPQPYVEAFELGTNVHEIIHRYYELLPSHSIPSPNEIILFVSKAINDVVGQVTEDLKKRLLGFVEFEKKRFQVFKWDVKPLYVEKPIENEFVKGIVDIVFSKNNKPYAIVDWKSGYNVGVSEDIRLQLSVYKVILGVEKAYVVFLSNPYNGVIEISALSKEEVQKIVENVWSGIRSGKFERKENRYCYACPYNTICKISTLNSIVRERLLKI